MFRRVGGSFWNDDLAILAVEVGAFDRAVVQAWNTHIGPVDVTGLGVHGNAVGQPAIGHDGLFVGPVCVHRMNTTSVQLKNE